LSQNIEEKKLTPPPKTVVSGFGIPAVSELSHIGDALAAIGGGLTAGIDQQAASLI